MNWRRPHVEIAPCTSLRPPVTRVLAHTYKRIPPPLPIKAHPLRLGPLDAFLEGRQPRSAYTPPQALTVGKVSAVV